MPSRRAASLLGAALAVGSLPLLALPGAASAEGPATTTFTKTLPYQCDVSVTYLDSALTLPDFPIATTISFAVPTGLKPFQKVDPTNVNVSLDMGEDLRSATTGLLEGVAADGASTNTYLFLRAFEGQRTTYKIPKLSAPKADIPQEAGTPWIIKASGVTPEVTTISSRSNSIQAPERFDIDATIYKADGSSQPVGLSCDTQVDKTLATVAVGETTTVTSVVPSKIKANTVGSFVVQVRGKSTLPTGSVSLFKGDKQIAQGNLNTKGNVRLYYPKLGQTGKRTFTLRYFGDDNHGLRDTPVTLNVVR